MTINDEYKDVEVIMNHCDVGPLCMFPLVSPPLVIVKAHHYNVMLK